MKYITKPLLASCVAIGLTAVPALAVIDTSFSPNDVILGFRAASGNGTSTTYMVNLGSATTYRDATSNMLNIANIGSALSSAYDANWYERTNLWAGFVSATNGQNVDNTGGVAIASQTTDYNSTIYVSTRRTALGTAGTANSTRPGNTIALDAQVMGSDINTLGGTFNSISTSGVYNGASSVTNSWNTFMGGSTGADFSGAYNVESAFTVGNRGVFEDAGTVEQMWDFYRVAQFPVSDTDAGKGIFQGTFALNSSGDVSFIVGAAAVPEPSTYALIALTGVLYFFVNKRRKSKI
jgi:hypothetical protein